MEGSCLHDNKKLRGDDMFAFADCPVPVRFSHDLYVSTQ